MLELQLSGAAEALQIMPNCTVRTRQSTLTAAAALH